ncbi:FecR family protein [Pedobacter sp. MC2016-14]|uniref:FecR family protein n=1 Tax=Pedobacter sp. MC2016-14 TaxID=2897327 RepID=UPI001E522014|nr:FecR family protein [Pedobacter sp. MC2016-14]MCD0487782.1 FecR family protein [Pedobacter sp. MC2016-14]
MDNKQVDILLDKLASGQFTAREEQQVRLFIHHYRENGDSGLTGNDFLAAENEMWEVIQGRLPKKRNYTVWNISIAAALAIMMFGAGLFYFKNPLVQPKQNIVYNHDIPAGGSKATLKLSNGKTIQLSSNKTAIVIDVSSLKYSDGSVVSTGAAREKPSGTQTDTYNTITTPRGGSYQVILPDHSKIWLNAASSITFPTTFAGSDKRKIELSGEAYFEIKKDRAHPFIVKTQNQTVTVLGTHFNINCYPDEPVTKTTLLEGSVMVSVLQNGRSKLPLQTAILKPGQQSEMQNNSIDISLASEDATAWKDGKFRFNHTSLESSLRQLSRWYNMDIKYVGGIPDRKFTGGINRNISLVEALEIFNYMDVKFKIDKNTIIVSH